MYRPLRNLYFQFIKGTDFDGKLDWNDVATAFQIQGYIKLVPDRHEQHAYKGYMETERMRNISSDQFRITMNEVLSSYLEIKNKGDVK